MSTWSGASFGVPNPDAGAYEDGALRRMFRRSCSECGAGVTWHTPSQLRATLLPEGAARVDEALAYVGPDVEAWACSRCTAWGLI